MTDRLARARARVEDFRRSKPGAAELALLASLAVRIEPELLRTLRLKVAPHLDVGAEADLWFSPIVQSRGVDGITLSAEVADVLRESLRTDVRLPLVWDEIEKCHRKISPALFLEEKVAWLALSGKPTAEIEEELAPALVALAKEGRTGLAPWAARALPRLPSAARSTRVAWVLSLTASRTLSGGMILEEGAPVDLLDEDLTGILPDLGEIDLGIRRTGGTLEIGDVRGDGVSTIRVAETVPRLVEVRWEDETGERRKISSLRPGSLAEEEVGWGAVRLRTLTGAVYELPAWEKSEEAQDSAEFQDHDHLRIRFQPSTLTEEYLAQVVSSPVGEAQDTFRSSPEIDQLLDVWSSAITPNEEVAQDLGARLWKALFSGAIGRCLEQSLAFEEIRRRGLEIRLRFGEGDSQDLVRLPWELLYREDRREFVALSRRTPVTRLSASSYPARRLPPFSASEPLRVLVVTALPQGVAPIKLEEESRRIQASLRMPRTEVIFLTGATFSNLRSALRANAFQILHFAGHGEVKGLVFENEEGGADMISGAVLKELFRSNRSLRLVFLNADRSSVPGGVAYDLLEAGVPAVVGMQASISDRAALIFSEQFYRGVAAGQSIVVAMTNARLALYLDSPQDASWAVPVLLMNEIEGSLFERAEAPSVSTAEMAQGSRTIFDPLQLSTAGWGIIFAPDIGEDVREALRPLLEWRRRQAGNLYQHFDFQPGQTAVDFLRSRGVEPGATDPKRVPYYLLLVGDPRSVPFDFQAELDVDHAVGRLWFERLEEYLRYAQSVLRAEQGATRRDRQITFFGVENQDDRATQQVCQGLVLPLAQEIEQRRRDWQVRLVHGEQATKEKLRRLLSKSEMPALLFTASHGASFPPNDPRQLSDQGALICQDWPGPREWRGQISRDHYFSAEDLAEDVDLSGMVAFLFLCFGSGTPEHDNFGFYGELGQAPRRIAPHPFVARLPQKLLDRGMLAVLSHSDRAWTMSFHWGDESEISLFRDMLARLLEGVPVGHAMEPFGRRAAELAAQLGGLLEEQALGGEVDVELIARLRVAASDAKSFSVFGDPAVRLRFGNS